jgi:hypothetical protein
MDSYQSTWAATKAERESAKSALAEYIAAKKAIGETRKLELGKILLAKQITVRQNALAKLQAYIASGRCSALEPVDTGKISVQVTAVNANLIAQGTTASSITSSNQVASLSKQIIENNRVFMIVSPSVRGQCNSDLLINKITNNIEPLVEKMVSLGLDTSKLTGYLEDAKEMAARASSLYRQAIDNRAQAPTATVNEANTNLQKAITDLNLAAVEAKSLLGTGGSGGSTASP